MIMIFPNEFEAKIGFDAVRSRLRELCESEMGRHQVDEMSFSSSETVVRGELASVGEMAGIIRAAMEMPSSPLYDVAPYLAEIRAEGSFMSPDRLYRLGRMLRAMDEVRRFFGSVDGDSGRPRYTALSAEFGGLEVFPEITAEIERILNKYGEVKDTASPRLSEIRRSIAAAQSSMSGVMRRVIDRAAAEGLIDSDTTPQLRDGRLCLPVSPTVKRKVNGIVHDESATGRTVFIEPAEVVEAGNRLRELQLEEHREIIAILVAVSAMIRPSATDIADAVGVLGRYDFIRAKSRYAILVDAQMPNIESRPEIDWYHAVHPVLLLSLRDQGREVVPLTLRLDGHTRFLVISGPNAGGKSVTLKTVGIVQYMLQCGMMPTVYSNSHMGLFDKLFIDIGDEQSIENDLSTYSSHLRNMKYFMSHADAHTLLLADEMGSGTEPQIGGALAQAILARLNSTKCFGIVTTHYQNLKTFAESEDGFVNGAMLYDRQHLRPLFKLAVGSPGSSFALEIARNTGLPSDVVEHAKQIVGSDYVNMDKYLLDIARDRRYWANKRQSIKEKEHKLDAVLERYEGVAGDLRSQRAAILADARAQARELMETANRKLERAIHDIRKAEAEKERTKEIRRELEDYKRSLNENDGDTDDKKLPEALRQMPKRRKQSEKKTAVAQKSTPLSAGDYVRMSDGGVVGKILAINGKEAEVAFGALRTRVAADKLRRADKPRETAAAQSLSVTRQTTEESRRRQLDFKTEIDVRGMRADEAIQAVTYYLDDAIQFSAKRVRILHGTGHGILRTLIRQQLQANPAVESFADEDVRFGGAGITIVNLG